LFIGTTHIESVVRADLHAEATEYTAPDIELNLIHDIFIPAVPGSLNVYDAMGAALGTGGTTSAQVGSPDELLATSTARYLKLMFRVLRGDLFTKQVLEG
jgi:hypothetical protein